MSYFQMLWLSCERVWESILLKQNRTGTRERYTEQEGENKYKVNLSKHDNLYLFVQIIFRRVDT